MKKQTKSKNDEGESGNRPSNTISLPTAVQTGLVHGGYTLPVGNPLADDFRIALTRVFGMDTKYESEQPFSQPWEDAWFEIASDTEEHIFFGYVFDRSQVLFPGSAERLRVFKESDGLFFLEDLAQRGASPNFILSLFVKYLWNERIPQKENDTYTVNEAESYLASLRQTRRIYHRYVNPPLIDECERNHDESYWMTPIIEREADEFEIILGQMEATILNNLKSKDLRAADKRRPPNEKANRVIFTLHEHFRVRTGLANWEMFWDLLVASDTIRGNGALGNKDRQLRPHIDSFQKDHPKEAAYIHDGMAKNLAPFSHW